MTEWTLDDADLESYINGFYGYGRYEAKYWFVGMEFGGGKSVAEIESQVRNWHTRGCHELEDLSGPEGVAGASRWFQGRIPLQRTWTQIIRVILSAEGQVTTTEDVRRYQKERLGRKGGLDCILELLPLPSRKISHWLLSSEHTQLPYLQDRDTYTRHVAPMRAAHLRKMIAKHRPHAVVFYGTGFEHWWREIAGVDFKPTSIEDVSAVSNGHTLFVSMQHPTAHGRKNTYFEAVGLLIASVARS